MMLLFTHESTRWHLLWLFFSPLQRGSTCAAHGIGAKMDQKVVLEHLLAPFGRFLEALERFLGALARFWLDLGSVWKDLKQIWEDF